MSTWEQRMAQRPYARSLTSKRDGDEYQRARLYGMIRAASHARGPQPHDLAPCCWRDKWLGDVWGVELICVFGSRYWSDPRPQCDHKHHETEGLWMAGNTISPELPPFQETDLWMRVA